MGYIEGFEMGNYPFEDCFFYDPVVHKNENIIETKIHEGIHYYLAQNSLYGTVISLLLSLAKIHGNKKIPFSKIARILIDRSRTTQEACATFGEIIYVNTYNVSRKDEKLAKLSPEYYKYVQDLLPLLKYNSDQVMKLTFDAAIAALDTNFEVLPEGHIIVPKRLDRYIQQKRLSFDPDKRFSLVVNHILGEVNSGGDIQTISVNDTCTTLGIVATSNRDAQRNTIEWLKKQLFPCVSPEAIEALVVEYSEPIEPMFWFDSGLPLAINKRYVKKRNVLPDLKTPGALVVFHDTNHFSIAWLDYTNGINYSFNVSSINLVNLYNKITNPIIITIEDYNSFSEFFEEKFNQRNLFIYNNNKYQTSINFIEAHISPGREAFIMEYNQRAFYLFIKLRSNYILIQPVEPQNISQVLSKHRYINGEKDDNKKVFFKDKISWTIYEDIIYSVLQIRMYDKIDEIRPNFMVFKEE